MEGDLGPAARREAEYAGCEGAVCGTEAVWMETPLQQLKTWRSTAKRKGQGWLRVEGCLESVDIKQPLRTECGDKQALPLKHLDLVS